MLADIVDTLLNLLVVLYACRQVGFPRRLPLKECSLKATISVGIQTDAEPTTPMMCETSRRTIAATDHQYRRGSNPFYDSLSQVPNRHETHIRDRFSQQVTIPLSRYPHIFSRIVSHSDVDALLVLRNTSRKVRNYVSPVLKFRHLQMDVWMADYRLYATLSSVFRFRTSLGRRAYRSIKVLDSVWLCAVPPNDIFALIKQHTWLLDVFIHGNIRAAEYTPRVEEHWRLEITRFAMLTARLFDKVRVRSDHRDVVLLFPHARVEKVTAEEA